MKIKVRVNGASAEYEIRPNELLLDFLRRIGCYSVKRGCDTGECGACAVIVDKRIVPTCQMLAAAAHGREITTVEGLGDPHNPHPLQKVFVELAAVQCGFCTPSMILAAKALLDKNPNPTEEDVKNALDGNLCRCTGYVKPVQAVLKAAPLAKGWRPAKK